MSANENSWRRFAAASDALLGGGLGPISPADPIAAELAIAARLRAEAVPAMPDPAFIERLRAELRVRMRIAGRAVAPMHFSALETPVGRLLIAYHEGRILRSALAGSEPDGSASAFQRDLVALTGSVAVADPAPPPDLVRGVREHIAGRRRFTMVDLSRLTPFQRKVLEKTAEIPRGEVRPYGWIAREIGAPGATRAVGTTLGHNPIPLLIPCHRVVRTDGSLGEYSGGGPDVKGRILEFEGLSLAALEQAHARGERLRGSRTTHIVCYPSCHAALRIRPENTVPFRSLAEARRTGYRPCEKCRPG